MSIKRNFYQTHNIHPATPRRLVSALHKAGWKERELARQRGVNILYVSQLLRHGIEPTDKTEKGRCTRVQLYLSKYKRKPSAPRPPIPEWLKPIKRGIRVMKKKTLEAIERRQQ